MIAQRNSLARGCAALAVAGILAAGCSSSKSTPAAPAPSTPAGGASTSAAPTGGSSSADSSGASQAVKDLYNKFFDNTTAAADKVNLVQQGPKMTQLVNELSNGAKTAKSSVAVHNVTLTDASHATVTFDILLNGTPALPNATGKAVLDTASNTWQIADETLCTLAGLTPGMNPATIKTACS